MKGGKRALLKKRIGALAFGAVRLLYSGYCPHPSNHRDGEIHPPSSCDALYMSYVLLARQGVRSTELFYKSPFCVPRALWVILSRPAVVRVSAIDGFDPLQEQARVLQFDREANISRMRWH